MAKVVRLMVLMLQYWPLLPVMVSSHTMRALFSLVSPLPRTLSLKENIIILCGHYKGVDQRVRDHLITKEYTIGDFVLTGGEIPAALMTDAIVRLLPGAMGDETSALSDSFQDGLLEPGVYTRPAEYKGWKVPEILLSGHQAKIEEWLYEESIRHTRERRPDLLDE